MTTPEPPPRIFSIGSGRPFLQVLVRALLAGDLPEPGGRRPSPLELADVTLILPTRRAVRAVQEAFLAAGAQRALLLPRIRPIGDGDEDHGLLAGLASAAPDIGDEPPAIDELARRLVLTQLVLAWDAAKRRAAAMDEPEQPVLPPRSPAQAAALAGDLARLMDGIETEDASLASLATLVPDSLSEHWQATLDFLKIVTEHWPAYLSEQGVCSPASRRNALIRAEAERLAKHPPAGPVIVAGVTGSIPATVELMRVVATLPHGAIVLPALDMHLDEESWQAIVPDHPEHPQYGLAKLLTALGVSRQQVRRLPGDDENAPARLRQALVSEAMRPAGTTHLWHPFIATTAVEQMRAALAGMTLLEAPSAQDEAEAISLILREAAEIPGKTAALVTPDRLLARRVAIRLEAWGLRVDDSAGRPIAKTVPGTFLELVLDAVATRFEPVALMALLKHPLARLGLPAADVRRSARALEIIAFRAPYLGEGLDGISQAIERAERETSDGQRRGKALDRLWPADWASARDLVARLAEAFAPLETLFRSDEPDTLAALAAAHVTVAEAMARLPDDEPGLLWHGEAGEAAALIQARLMDAQLAAPEVRAVDYPDLYRALITGTAVRPRVPVHPRIFIWGPFESRLQQTDVMVLGGLNEGTWPESADPGPWLNRPMRQQLGLPQPEEVIGHAAHDVATMLGAPVVVLTRAAKVDGVPAVPSRWLLRLNALLGGLDLAGAIAPRPEAPWLHWARQRDHTRERIRIGRPAPCPPLAARPRRISVTDVERWIANPYAIFARHVLGLQPMPPLGDGPGARERGQIIHAVLGRFATDHPAALPNDIAGAVRNLGDAILGAYLASPRVRAFWRPRLARFADWFGETEPARRQGVTRVLAEVSGRHRIEAPAGPFTLTARADRLDIGSDGALAITDYKTGNPPPRERVTSLKAPQLPLEAAIALLGGFPDVAGTRITNLRYIAAKGGEPPGAALEIDGDPKALAEDALKAFTTLVTLFDDEATAYKAVRRPGFDYTFDDFAHLARVAEWSSGDDGEG
ncbi:MAG: double-strand break repair protein AddB [Hyphomicrobiaceae bacterium]